MIGAGGAVNIALAPNEGATPAGTYYRVVLSLNDGSSSTEYWTVPSASPTTIAAIRASVVPSSVAAQYVRTSGDQSIAGSKTFTGPLALGDITGALQCLHVDTTGLISGTGSDCGAGSGGLPASLSADANTNAGGHTWQFTNGMANFGGGTDEILTPSPAPLQALVHTTSVVPGPQSAVQIELNADPSADAKDTVGENALELSSATEASNAHHAISGLRGAIFDVEHHGSGDMYELFGMESDIGDYSSAATIDQMTPVYIGRPEVDAGSTVAEYDGIWIGDFETRGTGIVTNAYGLRILKQARANTGHSYGVYLDDVGTGANDYAFYSVGGKNYLGGSLTLGGISGSTQCLHVNSSGLITGTGADCGTGGGGVSHDRDLHHADA